jgi:hypothetical protein
MVLLLAIFTILIPTNSVWAVQSKNLGPTLVGNRQAALFIRINNPQNTLIQLRLFDINTHRTIQHVTYQIAIDREPASADEKPVLSELFHSHIGQLNLNIEPSNNQQVSIVAEQDPVLNAWLADSSGTVLIKGLSLSNGVYHFQVNIYSIDNDRIIFTSESAPKFDTIFNLNPKLESLYTP